MMQLALQDRGLPVRASQVLLYALVPDVGRVVFAHLDGREVPAEIDPDWAAYIVRVYSDPSLKWVRQWSHDVSDRQAMIDAIKGAGGVVYREQLESLIVPAQPDFPVLPVPWHRQPRPGNRPIGAEGWILGPVQAAESTKACPSSPVRTTVVGDTRRLRCGYPRPAADSSPQRALSARTADDSPSSTRPSSQTSTCTSPS